MEGKTLPSLSFGSAARKGHQTPVLCVFGAAGTRGQLLAAPCAAHEVGNVAHPHQPSLLQTSECCSAVPQAARSSSTSLSILPVPLPSFSKVTTPFSHGVDGNHTQGGSQGAVPWHSTFALPLIPVLIIPNVLIALLTSPQPQADVFEGLPTVLLTR